MKQKKTRFETLLKNDRATKYAHSVVTGKEIANRHIIAACKRHITDIDKAERRGWIYDPGLAARAIKFIERFIKLNGGQFEGKPFILQPAQAFIVGSIFGWVHKDTGYRRFRRVYIEMGKGNGKSPLVAAICLYLLIADGEERAEIYAAAAKKEQAMVMFRDALAMVQQSEELDNILTVTGGDHTPNIAFLETNSFFRPLSNEKAKSGARPHGAACDELHEHPDRDTVEMLERGFKWRRQPLLIMITNSGFDKNTLCWEEHDHAIKVAHGDVQDDRTLGLVYGIDIYSPDEKKADEKLVDDDPLKDETCWKKANPLLGVIVREEELRDAVHQANTMPGKKNQILRLHFCVWTEAHSVLIPRVLWEACEDKGEAFPEEFVGCPSYGGLDLSAKKDLTAFAEVWKKNLGYFTDSKTGVQVPINKFYAQLYFWTPADSLNDRQETDRVPYRQWRDEGYINTVPGMTVDYAYVAPVIINALDRDIKSIAYDRWRIDLLKKELEDSGAFDPRLQPFGQGFKEMNLGVEALESSVLNGRLRVKFNPVLRWNVACGVVESDPAGNRKFAKHKATGRIDGMVALAMALAVAQSCEEEPDLSDFLNNPLKVRLGNGGSN